MTDRQRALLEMYLREAVGITLTCIGISQIACANRLRVGIKILDRVLKNKPVEFAKEFLKAIEN